MRESSGRAGGGRCGGEVGLVGDQGFQGGVHMSWMWEHSNNGGEMAVRPRPTPPLKAR